MSKRPENGPMRFGEDWTGLFLRGDESVGNAFRIRNALRRGERSGSIPNHVTNLLESLERTFLLPDERQLPDNTVQLLQPWQQCQAEEGVATPPTVNLPLRVEQLRAMAGDLSRRGLKGAAAVCLDTASDLEKL